MYTVDTIYKNKYIYIILTLLKSKQIKQYNGQVIQNT
jgi:hypothetical protein